MPARAAAEIQHFCAGSRIEMFDQAIDECVGFALIAVGVKPVVVL